MGEEDHKYFPFAELEYLAARTTSTGYLEDALFFSKQRRLPLPDQSSTKFQSQYEWEKSAQNFHGVAPEVHHHQQLGEISSSSAASAEPDPDYSSSSSGRCWNDFVGSQYSSHHDDDDTILAGTKSVSSVVVDSCDSATQQLLHQHFAWVGRGIEIKEEAGEDDDVHRDNERKQQKTVALSTNADGGGRRIKRRRVAYPFALVKPGGGEEGVMTIDEINSRLLMAPTRPLRHPVGDFACRPFVSAAGRPGLSGKAVVALTKIYTQGGKGTVTIIRTKG